MANDKYNSQNIPETIKNRMYGSGISPSDIKGLTAAQASIIPSTIAGATALQGIGQADLTPSLGGITYKNPDPKSGPYILLNSDKDRLLKDTKQTLGHEMEHALMMQGLGPQHKGINEKWDELTQGNTDAWRSNVVKRLVDNRDYLVKNWGLDPLHAKHTEDENGKVTGGGYFSPMVLNDPNNPSSVYLYEQLATLSALEQAKNKRLTDDPYVRDNIFTDRDQREAYNALTGLRQSRLDPRDLPPYTRVEDKNDPSLGTKVKSMFGFSKGGSIDKPLKGGSKLI